MATKVANERQRSLAGKTRYGTQLFGLRSLLVDLQLRGSSASRLRTLRRRGRTQGEGDYIADPLDE